MTVKHPRLDLKTSVGRLVAGDLANASDVGYNNQKREKPQYFFALAIPKTDPQTGPLLNQIISHVWQSYQFAPQVQQRLQMAPGGNPLAAQQFAWKIDDGDDPKFADRPGYPGCFILKFATTIPFRCADSSNQQIDPATIDLGNYGDVAFNLSINGNIDHTAGCFMNPACFRLIGFGEKIIPGRSIAEMMGNAPALPHGASATPVAPAQPAAPGFQQTAPAGVPPMQQTAPAAPGFQQTAPAGVPPMQVANPLAPGAGVPGVANDPAAPAGVPQMQPAAPVPGFQQQPMQPAATAYPSNAYGQPMPNNTQPGPNPQQPVQPHPNFVYGGQQ